MLEKQRVSAAIVTGSRAEKCLYFEFATEPAREQDVWANIPPKSNRKGSFVFSAFLYRYRNLVERFFNKLKQFRGIATRYDKNPENFLAAIRLASGSAVMSLRPS